MEDSRNNSGFITAGIQLQLGYIQANLREGREFS